jgi:hypothetical protein
VRLLRFSAPRTGFDGLVLEWSLELDPVELANLKSHFATSSWGGRRKPPLAFTEHGAIMAATILNGPRAVQMTVYVVRAFLRFREALASHASLARKLDALERSLMQASAETQRQFREVYEAIRLLQPRAARGRHRWKMAPSSERWREIRTRGK